MQAIQVFNNPLFGNVRVIGTEENPQFCLTDVCKALDLQQGDVKRRLDDGVVSTQPISDSLGRVQQANFVNEDGLYDVILDSRKPEAKQFRKWITSEVLPIIRKHGAYMTDKSIEKALTDPDFLIQLATELKNEKQKRLQAEQTIVESRPKVLFADAVTTSSDSILVGELAKLIKQNGVNTGQKRLFEWMRNNGFLCKKSGESFNEPTQHSMELGLFELKKTVIQKPDGSSIISKTTKVTGKGQIYFVNKFLSQNINLYSAMKKYLSIYKNWRNDTLFAIFFLSLILLLGNTDDLLMFIVTKLLSFCGFALLSLLFKYWNSRGLIKELTGIGEED